MAEDPARSKKNPEKVPSPEPGPKKNWLKLILLAVAALVLLGGLGFGTRLFLKKRAARKAAAAEKDKAAPGAQSPTQDEASSDADADDCGDTGGKAESGGEGEGGPAAAPVMVLTRTVNLSGPRRNSFLRCELNILFCDNELGKLAAGDKPSPEKSIIESIVLSTLSGKTVDEASDPESRESIRQEIKDALNEKFKPHPKPGEEEDPKHKKSKHPIKSVLIVDWAIQQ